MSVREEYEASLAKDEDCVAGVPRSAQTAFCLVRADEADHTRRSSGKCPQSPMATLLRVIEQAFMVGIFKPSGGQEAEAQTPLSRL